MLHSYLYIHFNASVSVSEVYFYESLMEIYLIKKSILGKLRDY